MHAQAMGEHNAILCTLFAWKPYPKTAGSASSFWLQYLVEIVYTVRCRVLALAGLCSGQGARCVMRGGPLFKLMLSVEG